MEVADRRIVTLHFTLIDQDGNQYASTQGHAPLVHMQGTGNIIPALEEALAGKRAGEKFEITVPPERGFGPRFPALVQTLPRSLLDGGPEPAVGTRLQAKTKQGGAGLVTVTAVDGDTVSVDGNHPLAGQTFRMEVEVVDVRVATPDEIQFGVR